MKNVKKSENEICSNALGFRTVEPLDHIPRSTGPTKMVHLSKFADSIEELSRSLAINLGLAGRQIKGQFVTDKRKEKKR